MMFMLRVSPLLYIFGHFLTVQSFYCEPDYQGLCAATGSVIHQWDVIRLNCSVPNTLAITYSNYSGSGLPDFSVEDITYRSLLEVWLECTDQNGTLVNCAEDGPPVKITGPAIYREDTVTFSNLNESGILSGWTCSLSGCYEVSQISDEQPILYVQTPMKMCTLPGIEPITTFTEKDIEISTTTVRVNPTEKNNTDIEISTTTVRVNPTEKNNTDDQNNIMMADNHLFLPYISIIVVPVTLIIVFIIVLLIVLLGSIKQQRARIRKTLLVLDINNMVYDPNHAPPVCIDKPSFNFSQRLSVVSSDLIQNLKPEASITPLESSDSQSGSVHLDGSSTNEQPGSYTAFVSLPEPSIQLQPNTSIDYASYSSDSTLQLVEDKIYQSTTPDHNLNPQRYPLTQNDAAEYSDAVQMNIQVTKLSSLAAGDNNMINLDETEPSGSASDYLPSADFTHIPSFSSMPPSSVDIVQLDLPSNKEHNKDSLPQSQGYIKLECDTNIICHNRRQHQQTQFSYSVADLCFPIVMFGDNETEQGAPHPSTVQTSPSSMINVASQDDESDSVDEGSVVSFDFAGDTSEMQNSYQLELQQQNNTTGYL